MGELCVTCGERWREIGEKCRPCARLDRNPDGLPWGNSRAPKFGDRMRGIWASKENPHRDGVYVETIRRTGRMNRGTWYRMTDGKGSFWEYEAARTLFLPTPEEPTPDPTEVKHG